MKDVRIKKVMLVILFTVLLVFLFINLSSVGQILGTILKVLKPIIYGLIIAYILNWPYKFFYNKCFYKIKSKKKKTSGLRKALAMLCAYIIVFGIITVLFVFLIPQLTESIKKLVDDVPVYSIKVQNWLNNFITFIDNKTGLNLKDADTYNNVISALTGTSASNTISNIISWAFPFLLSSITTVGTGLYNWVLGIIVSIYMLSSKDRLLFGCRKCVVAFLPKKAAVKTLKICNFANNKCGRFIIGKIIDSAIIGVICFIFMSIFKFDYAVLISVIVGVTNVIPFFGPFIGAIPSAFLLLIVNPIQCIWFIIFIFVLQQFDGNILGPKILGETVGLSSFWILFSVLVAGGLFGITGMLLGVPVFAVIYTLIEDAVNLRLKKKAIAAQQGKYENQQLTIDDINENNNSSETVFKKQHKQENTIDVNNLSEAEIHQQVSNEDEKNFVEQIDEEAKARQSYYNQF